MLDELLEPFVPVIHGSGDSHIDPVELGKGVPFVIGVLDKELEYDAADPKVGQDSSIDD